MAEAENTCRVAIGKLDLDGVIAYRARGLGGHARLKHWQSGEGRSLGTRLRFLFALVIAHCTRARISQIGKIVVARMIIRPGDINALACRKMDFQADRFFSGVEWNWHIDRNARSLVPQDICPVPVSHTSKIPEAFRLAGTTETLGPLGGQRRHRSHHVPVGEVDSPVRQRADR
jgi:hypothetical protein